MSTPWIQVGKLLVATGILLVALGGLLMLLGRSGLSRLPGDLVFGGKNWKVMVPLGSCLLLSLLLSGLLWLIQWWRR